MKASVSKNAQRHIDLQLLNQSERPGCLYLTANQVVATTCFLIPASALSPYTQMMDW